MPHYNWYAFLNFSILFPAIAGMLRNKFVGKEFSPFLFLIWLGAANEIISFIFIKAEATNTVNSNIYVLLEYLLILYLFYCWNDTSARKYYFFGILGIVVWASDNFLINSITENNSIFRAFYSVILIFFSVDRFNKLLVFEKKHLLKNAQFLICTAFVIYYFCKTFVELANAFRIPFDNYFYMHLWIGLSVVNCIANLIFGFAILCIPRKPEFTLPY